MHSLADQVLIKKKKDLNLTKMKLYSKSCERHNLKKTWLRLESKAEVVSAN